MNTFSALWDKIPKWSKVVTSIVAALGAIGVMIGWGAQAADSVEWKKNAEESRKVLSQHHDEDMQEVLQLIADEKRYDRIGRNKRELKRLERDYIAGRYANQDEREFMKAEILDLKAAIRCDEDGVCP